ncbi:hypothetical protein BJ322DRAFT_1066467 [Thelephora terrestris]|uniref:Uncharacterized protein n=1 Tax=Thelephora terrestris TaxID=56493 RepID=A0A9P6HDF5_9AGAM|nr:hypothetical protein BJ322DRAFT_1066467 [Thelephora terrestris]
MSPSVLSTATDSAPGVGDSSSPALSAGTSHSSPSPIPSAISKATETAPGVGGSSSDQSPPLMAGTPTSSTPSPSGIPPPIEPAPAGRPRPRQVTQISAPASAPAHSSPLATAPVLAPGSTQAGPSLDDEDDSLAENDGSLADEHDSLDRTNSPPPANILSRPPVTSTNIPGPGPQDDDEIDELDDSPGDTAPASTSDPSRALETSQAPASGHSAGGETSKAKPKKITGKDICYDDWKKKNPKGSKKSHETGYWKNLSKEQKQVRCRLFYPTVFYPILTLPSRTSTERRLS